LEIASCIPWLLRIKNINVSSIVAGPMHFSETTIFQHNLNQERWEQFFRFVSVIFFIVVFAGYVENNSFPCASGARFLAHSNLDKFVFIDGQKWQNPC
jgi:hypothetical protein